MNTTEYETYNTIYSDLNNAGEGFAVGEDTDDINALSALLGPLLVRANSTSEVAVYEKNSDTVILVGDANGPWAVETKKIH